MTEATTRPVSLPASQPANAGNPLRWAAVDSAAMIGRSLRQSTRNADALLMAVILPVALLLLFVYVFGGAMSTGSDYVDYVVPGIILLCASFGSATTAVSVCTDMAGGIIDRFRSLPIHSSAVLTGHVVASVARNLVSTALVLGVALLMGFRPTAGVTEWLAAIGVLVLFMLAISWIAASLGLVAGTPEAANGYTFGFLFLPYVSSAFVPTDSMPRVLQAFAEHQPVTPIIETVRGLLMGTPIGSSWWIALVWCLAIAALGRIAAAALFRSRSVH